MAASLIETPHAKLAKHLSGQRVTIPSILSLTPGWESHLNPNCHPYLETSILEWQQKYIASDHLLRINQRVNLPLFIRMACPEADLNELCLVGKWYSWIFAYDDAIDHDYFKGKRAEREVYRDEALKCARFSLLGEDDAEHDPTALAPNFSLARGLYEIGFEIRQAIQQRLLRELICESMCEFINVAVDVGAFCESGDIADLDKYFATRMYTSGVYPSIWMSL
ncbi:hypothetical protein BJX99DRAFT_258363 [Aspergillus californicus]